MPVDAVGTGSRPIVDNYTIGANAKAKEEAKTLATTKEMSDAEKQALFLKKMNEGQKTDKAAQTKENPGSSPTNTTSPTEHCKPRTCTDRPTTDSTSPTRWGREAFSKLTKEGKVASFKTLTPRLLERTPEPLAHAAQPKSAGHPANPPACKPLRRPDPVPNREPAVPGNPLPSWSA